MERDILCAQTIEKVGEKVQICGWLSKKRHHGAISFLNIRDHSGEIQVVSEEECKIPVESIVYVCGQVIKRADDQKNENMITGNIEIKAEKIEIISKCSPLPFEIGANVSEDLQIKYRYLYLRNEKNAKFIKIRSDVNHFIRNFMHNEGFYEVHTPILTASAPEGARDFLVPSRLHRGKFYALPQAPQIFKQLLMVSGFPKYFQIAPCFRDEDARKDRCFGEFYQLDFEISFIKQEEILKFLQNLAENLFRKFGNKEIKFTRMTYDYALSAYGTDKPNLNSPLIIEDFTEVFHGSEMKIFKEKIQEGHEVKGFRCKGLNSSQEDYLLKYAESANFRAAFVSKKDSFKGPIAKFLNENICQEGESLFFVCNKKKIAEKNIGLLMREVDRILEIKDEKYEFIFITDFPMFEFEDGKWEFSHNPFSKSQNPSDSPENIKAFQYDLVCNGYELASGGIRNTDVENLIKNFEFCGYKKEEVEEKFKSIITAFKYGVPPHGGAALGMERIILLLTGENNVRNVVAFPLNTSGQDSLTGSPTEIDEKTLRNLGIKVL